MRLIVEKRAVRRILKWTQRALLACAFLFLGYCGFALADAWVFQKRESLEFDRRLRDLRHEHMSAPPAAANGLIGRLEIPRLLLSDVVVEGIGNTTLRRGIGHIPGTALPGESGNVGLAGHRDTLFRPLKDLKLKDEIRFSTLRGDFTYEVESLRVVMPEDVEVLAPSSRNVLTLVTCYPFYYIGAAPKRFIVRARQVSAQRPARSNVE